MTRQLDFSIHPDLLSKQLGSDMYSASEALKQLVANGLDSGATRVDVRVYFNELDSPSRVTIRDDGCGISPAEMDDAFREVGVHVDRSRTPRESIGSRGIGRFAVFSLAAEARWETTAETVDGAVRQRWTMVPGRRRIEIDEDPAPGATTGTTVDLTLRQRADVSRLFASVKLVKRALFNAFAGYLAKHENDVTVSVNDEAVSLGDFVDDRESEDIEPDGVRPGATLHHMVLNQQVDQVAPSLLVFASHGTTISQQVLGDEGIPGKKYLGLADSPDLSELTNTSKSALPEFDPRFQALKEEASSRARTFIARRQSNRAQEFLERARKAPYYPYKTPPQTPVERYSRQLFDGLLLTLEETYRIGNASSQQQELIFNLTRQLLRSEDLASVLTSVLGLKGEEVAKFAALLRRASLTSVIAVADLLVDRFRFLDELHELVYGSPARWLKERSQLHKIIESHTWLFGEQFHLMGSDKRIDTLLPKVAAALSLADEHDDVVEVDAVLRDIPDLYLARSKWNEGAKYHQHLIVELKRPSVRIGLAHVSQLTRYAQQIVENSIWGQRPDSHKFQFVLISSEISDAVTKSYQTNEEPGLLSRPTLQHPTELWALRWSDYLDRRREELKFLENEIEITTDPELLEYLRGRVGDYLPDQGSTRSEPPIV